MGESSPGKRELSLAEGRLCILLASVLWSLSGFFSKALTQPTWFELDSPPLSPMSMAFFRVMFAGLLLVPLLRKSDLTFKPAMLFMGLIFALMNVLFISALTFGTAANAILLQYSAPLWVYLVSVFFLGESVNSRSVVALVCGLLGIGIIIYGGSTNANLAVVALGLGAGVTYAAILLFLRSLRNHSAGWLTVWNHCFAAAALLVFALPYPMPSWPQLGWLLLFGTLQLGLPYWLMAHGLRVVNPREAGTITLLEPILVPVWAYLVSPETETVGVYTFIGGGLILGGLAWQYWPRKGELRKPKENEPI